MPVPSFSQQRINKVAAFQSILAAGYCTAVMACQLRFTYIERFGGGEGPASVIIVLGIDLLFLCYQTRKH